MTAPYFAIWKVKGSDPSPHLTDGWFSMLVKARDMEEARTLATAKMNEIAPVLDVEYELAVVEIYELRQAMAGPYRGARIEVE